MGRAAGSCCLPARGCPSRSSRTCAARPVPRRTPGRSTGPCCTSPGAPASRALWWSAAAASSDDAAKRSRWASSTCRQRSILPGPATLSPSRRAEESSADTPRRWLRWEVVGTTSTAARSPRWPRRADRRRSASWARLPLRWPMRCARCVGLLDPDLVVLGGGIGSSGALLPRLAAEELATLQTRPDPAPVVPASLGARAGLLGAALRRMGATWLTDQGDDRRHGWCCEASPAHLYAVRQTPPPPRWHYLHSGAPCRTGALSR